MFRRFTSGLALVLCLFAVAQAQAPLGDSNALVARAVKRELSDLDHPSSFWMYRVHKETKSGNAVRDMIETPTLILARTITWNGRTLTPEERQKEDDKLGLLLNNKDELASKQKEQREEKQRIVSLLAALPKALLYEYDGDEVIRGRNNIRLRFKPNPDYSPETRETYVFRGTEGKLWVDKAAERVTRLDATLTNDVNIGWGILGRINKGGKLYLEQQMVAPDQWKLVTLIVEADGKALFFKTINMKQKQFGSDYRRVPNNLTAERAIAMLRDASANNPTVAKTK
jgi:hypothetical protein